MPWRCSCKVQQGVSEESGSLHHQASQHYQYGQTSYWYSMMAGEPGAPSTKPEAAAAAAVTPASALRLLRDPTTAAAAAAAPAPATARPRIQPSALTLLLCHATAAPAAPMLLLPPLLLLLLLVMLLLLIPLRREDDIQLRGAAPAPAVAAPLPPRAATTRNIPCPATRMVMVVGCETGRATRANSIQSA